MADKFKFRHVPEDVRPYVPEGKEKSAEKFYRDNPGAERLKLLEQEPGWVGVLPETEEEMRGREAD